MSTDPHVSFDALPGRTDDEKMRAALREPPMTRDQALDVIARYLLAHAWDACDVSVLIPDRDDLTPADWNDVEKMLTYGLAARPDHADVVEAFRHVGYQAQRSR